VILYYSLKMTKSPSWTDDSGIVDSVRVSHYEVVFGVVDRLAVWRVSVLGIRRSCLLG